MEITGRQLSELIHKTTQEGCIVTPTRLSVGKLFTMELEKIEVLFNQSIIFKFVLERKRHAFDEDSRDDVHQIIVKWEDIDKEFKKNLVALIKI